MTTPAILALDCPGCGRPLPGLESDVAFACATCARAWELVDGSFTERPFAQVAPQGRGQRSHVNLPAWHFRVEVSVQVPEGGDSALVLNARRAAARAAEIHTAYVLACSEPRTDVFGDWGHRWTGIQPSWEKAAQAFPVAGASLGSGDARVLAGHYVYDLLDRLVEVSAVKISLRLGDVRLLAVPAAYESGRLASPWGEDLTLPVHALDGWFEIQQQATLPAGGSAG